MTTCMISRDSLVSLQYALNTILTKALSGPIEVDELGNAFLTAEETNSSCLPDVFVQVHLTEHAFEPLAPRGNLLPEESGIPLKARDLSVRPRVQAQVEAARLPDGGFPQTFCINYEDMDHQSVYSALRTLFYGKKCRGHLSPAPSYPGYRIKTAPMHEEGFMVVTLRSTGGKHV